MKRLRNLLKRFETVMTAEAFTEAGEFDTARKIMREEEKSADKQLRKRANKEQCARLTAN